MGKLNNLFFLSGKTFKKQATIKKFKQFYSNSSMLTVQLHYRSKDTDSKELVDTLNAQLSQ